MRPITYVLLTLLALMIGGGKFISPCSGKKCALFAFALSFFPKVF